MSPDAPPEEAGAPADLKDRADVAVLVDAFYRRVFEDPLICPIFTDVARMDIDCERLKRATKCLDRVEPALSNRVGEV